MQLVVNRLFARLLIMGLALIMLCLFAYLPVSIVGFLFFDTSRPSLPLSNEGIVWLANEYGGWFSVTSHVGILEEHVELDINGTPAHRRIAEEILYCFTPIQISDSEAVVKPQITISFQNSGDPTNIDICIKDKNIVFKVRDLPWVYVSPKKEQLERVLHAAGVEIATDSVTP